MGVKTVGLFACRFFWNRQNISSQPLKATGEVARANTMNKVVRVILITILVFCASWSSAAFSSWFTETLIDPEDGMLDASDYLASARGFLPIPIIITEPAVGYGLGVAVAYFHAPKELDKEEHPHVGPPSISVGFGAKTENGTYLYGGAHSGVWKDDHIRYLGVLAKMNVNMSFYPDGPIGDIIGPDGIGFNINGYYLEQEMQFRLKESNWWLGGNYMYINADNTFKPGLDLPIDLPDPSFDFTLGAISMFVKYDGRNSTFTPTNGLSAKLEFQNFDERWGSDFNYDSVSGEVLKYIPFGDYSSMGLRLEGQTVNGDVPFFGYPFVDLRGIPAMRYQGQDVVVGEVEYLWGVTPRWTVVFFGGLGHTTPIADLDGESNTVAAGGMGFRYRLARKLGLQSGIDIARGPEDTSFYITVGSAWQ